MQQRSERVDGLAIAAFVVSIPLGWLGVILGFVARANLKRNPARGMRFANAAIVIGFCEVAIFLVGAILFATVNAGP